MSSMRAGSLAMLPAGGRHRDWADVGQDSALRTAEVATVGRGRAGTHGVLQTHIYLVCAGKRNITRQNKCHYLWDNSHFLKYNPHGTPKSVKNNKMHQQQRFIW